MFTSALCFAFTHVVLPLQSADGRVGAHRALEVDVVALLDGLGAQRRAQAQLDDRRICKKKKKKMMLSLQSEFPSECIKVWKSMGMVDWRGEAGRQLINSGADLNAQTGNLRLFILLHASVQRCKVVAFPHKPG